MTKVMTGASMSLDGYIAGPNDSGFEHLFKWYTNGDVEVPMGDIPVRTSAVSAEHLRGFLAGFGAAIVGRRLYDTMGGWGGRHPMDVPVVVVTHRMPTDRPAEDDDYVFSTGGIEAAVEKARELAGDKHVAVNGGTIARQCLDAGLLDEVHIDLVPVLLGAGTPFFGELGAAPVELEGPTSMVAGDGVTHLAYRVVRPKG